MECAVFVCVLSKSPPHGTNEVISYVSVSLSYLINGPDIYPSDATILPRSVDGHFINVGFKFLVARNVFIAFVIPKHK